VTRPRRRTGTGLSCGGDVGLTVATSYDGKFAFNGLIDRVVGEVDSEQYVDADEVAAAAIAQQ
jgi:hypothetical protein